MEEALGAILICVVCCALGFGMGRVDRGDDIDNACANYGKYATSKYILTCEVKK